MSKLSEQVYRAIAFGQDTLLRQWDVPLVRGQLTIGVAANGFALLEWHDLRVAFVILRLDRLQELRADSDGQLDYRLRRGDNAAHIVGRLWGACVVLPPASVAWPQRVVGFVDNSQQGAEFVEVQELPPAPKDKKPRCQRSTKTDKFLIQPAPVG